MENTICLDSQKRDYYLHMFRTCFRMAFRSKNNRERLIKKASRYMVLANKLIILK